LTLKKKKFIGRRWERRNLDFKLFCLKETNVCLSWKEWEIISEQLEELLQETRE